MVQQRRGGRTATQGLCFLMLCLVGLSSVAKGAYNFVTGLSPLVSKAHAAPKRTLGGPRASSKVVLGAVEPGKVNLAQKINLRDFLLGEEPEIVEVKEVKEVKEANVESKGGNWAGVPTLECDEACVAAIEDCLEGGCSVEAIQKLDEALALDEAKVAKALAKEENSWLANFLQRTGALRAQLATILQEKKDVSFGEQLVRAASVAFGGSRPNDYPESGVSPYSS